MADVNVRGRNCAEHKANHGLTVINSGVRIALSGAIKSRFMPYSNVGWVIGAFGLFFFQ